METAIIAAIVAAFVSLIGFLINLRIAKENKKALAENLRITSQIKLSEQSVTELGDFLAESEGLRFTCIRIASILRSVKQGKEEPRNVLLREFYDEYRSKQNTFFPKWFRVLKEIRGEKPIRLAALMHDGNNICAAITGLLQLSLKESGGGKFNIPDHYSKPLIKELDLLIKHLEELNKLLISERNDRLGEIWGKRPVSALETVRNIHQENKELPNKADARDA